MFLFLFLFFCLQVIDATIKQGVKAGLVLAFTSIVIFPIVCVLEIVACSPSKPEDTQIDPDDFVMSAKEMLIFDGIVYHKREEQAENSFTYHIRCALVNLDSPPDNFAGGPPASFLPHNLSDSDLGEACGPLTGSCIATAGKCVTHNLKAPLIPGAVNDVT